MVNTGSTISAFARKLVKTLGKKRRLLIYIKGSPDPDAMGSSFALKWLCDCFNTPSVIHSPLLPSLPQNSKMIKDLGIPIGFGSDSVDLSDFDGYGVLDHPSVEVEGITGVLPCVVHVDHHDVTDSQVPVACRLVMEEVGATSTIMALVLKALEPELTIDSSQYQRLATALYLGIKTDTDGFQLATETDHQALDHIYPFVNTGIIQRIDEVPLSKNAHRCLTRAIKNRVIINEWLVSGLGYIDAKNRDSMAIVADYLINSGDISRVMVFALVRGKSGLVLDVSIRTRDERFDLNAFIKKITTEGGARTFKGGFQVNLDYFVNCPAPDLVWKVVSMTTLDTIQRLGLPKKVTFFQQMKNRIRKGFHTLLGKNRKG